MHRVDEIKLSSLCPNPCLPRKKLRARRRRERGWEEKGNVKCTLCTILFNCFFSMLGLDRFYPHRIPFRTIKGEIWCEVAKYITGCICIVVTTKFLAFLAIIGEIGITYVDLKDSSKLIVHCGLIFVQASLLISDVLCIVMRTVLFIEAVKAAKRKIPVVRKKRIFAGSKGIDTPVLPQEQEMGLLRGAKNALQNELSSSSSSSGENEDKSSTLYSSSSSGSSVVFSPSEEYSSSDASSSSEEESSEVVIGSSSDDGYEVVEI